MGALARILLVEDEPLIAEMLREWLAELDCEVVGPAASNEAGLALLEQSPVTGAILDVTISDGHSYKIAEALQETGVPFVFATGHVSESIDPRFRDAPVLQKPFEFNALADFVAHLKNIVG
jgi:DNA-binding response OmpR family regulator